MSHRNPCQYVQKPEALKMLDLTAYTVVQTDWVLTCPIGRRFIMLGRKKTSYRKSLLVDLVEYRKDLITSTIPIIIACDWQG